MLERANWFRGGTSEAFATQVVADFPPLDVLFNNAGIITFEDLTGRRDLADAEGILAWAVA